MINFHSSSTNSLDKMILKSPWKNVYWFARMLINSDKYGGIGKENDLMARISSQLRLILEDTQRNDLSKVELSHQVIKRILEKRFKNAKTKIDRVMLFCSDLKDYIKTVEDVKVFILTIEAIIIPINNALNGIPSNDREYAEDHARIYLDTLGYNGLSTVITFWDDLGLKGCLDVERAAVIREFSRLRRDIESMPELEANMILSAFVQEFERRLGQKRKSRAGTSLEDVTSFLFDYYGIVASHAPDHFQADIEVDKWVKCKDGWLIGISCKRTLRERWKQVSSADRGVLSTYKIKQIWHLITFDEDLSDEKITTLGSQGHIFYLSDDSRILVRASSHVGMKDYVRKMSGLIKDLKKEMKS